MTEADDSGRRPRAPGIDEAVAQLRTTGRAAWNAGGDTLKALRTLIAADAALARSAFGRALALTGIAIMFGASCWLLLMAALVTGVAHALGVAMPIALLLCALLSAGITAWAIWRAIAYFGHTSMRATRRQLSELRISEFAKFGSSENSRKSSPSANGNGADGHARKADRPTQSEQDIDTPPS